MIGQINVSSTFLSTSILQYGVLGIVAATLGYFAFHQYKRLIQRNDALELKVDMLQRDMMNILVEERDRMSKLISDNTAALTDLQKTIVTYIVAANASK